MARIFLYRRFGAGLASHSARGHCRPQPAVILRARANADNAAACHRRHAEARAKALAQNEPLCDNLAVAPPTAASALIRR